MLSFFSHLFCFHFRILHTVIIDDPYDDPDGLDLPPKSPEPDIKDYEVSYYISCLVLPNRAC